MDHMMMAEKSAIGNYTAQTSSEYYPIIQQLYERHTKDKTLLVFRGEARDFRTTSNHVTLGLSKLWPSEKVPSTTEFAHAIEQYLTGYLESYMRFGHKKRGAS